MQKRHRARANAAVEAIADHEIDPFAQFRYVSIEVQEVVAVVAVAHDHVAPARSRYARAQRRAVAPFRYVNNTGTLGAGKLNRTVRRSIVGDDDFAGNSRAGEEGQGLLYADFDGLRFVEARHKDAEFHLVQLLDLGLLLGDCHA